MHARTPLVLKRGCRVGFYAGPSWQIISGDLAVALCTALCWPRAARWLRWCAAGVTVACHCTCC